MTIQFDKKYLSELIINKRIMSNIGFSYIAIHPGEVLKEELEARNISQKDFAKAISVSYTMLNEILNGKRNITADFALLVEAALGTPAELWLNMQARYNLQTSKTKESVRLRVESIRNISPWATKQTTPVTMA